MRILVPLDGSDLSMESVKIAADYARDRISTVFLLTVLPVIDDMDLELPPQELEHLINISHPYKLKLFQ